MAEEEDKKDDLFLTPDGSTLGYISLEQARVVAMRTARDQPGEYGQRFSGMRMVFDVVEQEEGEDYYIVTLSMRPEGDFVGRVGQEQFFIEKEGNVAHRQVLSLPRMTRGGFPKGRVAIGVFLVVLIAAIVIIALGPRDKEQTTGGPGEGEIVVVDDPGDGIITEGLIIKPEKGFALNLSGFFVEPGQTTVEVPNGTVFLSVPSDNTGYYPGGLEMTLEAVPHAEGSEIIWEGVDFIEGDVAGIIMDGDRFINLEIRPPFTVGVTPEEPFVDDDFGDTMDSAFFVDPGEIRGVINHAFDLDYFGFFSREGSTYALEVLLETHPDVFITLFDQDGKYLADNDDINPQDLGAALEFQARYSGDYFLEVRSAVQDTDVGSYRFFLTPLSDGGGGLGGGPVVPVDRHGDDRQSATRIFLGSTVGEINPSDDLGIFRFFALANTTYVAEVKLDTHPDTGLVLMNGRGQVIEDNDDAEGLGRGSRVIWTAPPLGNEYFLAVGSIDPEIQTGSYVITLDEIADVHGDSLHDATPLIFGPANIGAIDPADDVDYFEFFARAGDSFVFAVELDGHPDTVLTLYQARGIKLDASDNDPAMISWTAPAAGEYFLEVSSFDRSNQTGGYALFAKEATAPAPRPTPTAAAPFLIQGLEPRDFATGFIKLSNEAEILSLLNLDPSFSQPYFDQGMMRNLENSIVNLKNQNLYAASDFHSDDWYVPEVRVVNESLIEVDSCEFWSTSYYTLDNNAFWSSDPKEMLPQTVTLERTVAGWRMTQVEFWGSPNFC